MIREMIRAMYDFDGSGLAAPQVGMDERIFVADAGDGPFAMVNPELLRITGKETVLEEGCLSLPGIRIKVTRPEMVFVRYLDESGRVIERELTGLMAKIFQHEGDHLFGRMIIDYATPADRGKFRIQLAKLEALSSESGLRRSKVNV